MKNLNSDATSAPAQDPGVWDAFVLDENNKRTKAYEDNSEQGKQETAAEEDFDRITDMVYGMVGTNNFTNEDANKFLNTLLEKYVQDITNIRREYYDEHQKVAPEAADQTSTSDDAMSTDNIPPAAEPKPKSESEPEPDEDSERQKSLGSFVEFLKARKKQLEATPPASADPIPDLNESDYDNIIASANSDTDSDGVSSSAGTETDPATDDNVKPDQHSDTTSADPATGTDDDINSDNADTKPADTDTAPANPAENSSEKTKEIQRKLDESRQEFKKTKQDLEDNSIEEEKLQATAKFIEFLSSPENKKKLEGIGENAITFGALNIGDIGPEGFTYITSQATYDNDRDGAQMKEWWSSLSEGTRNYVKSYLITAIKSPEGRALRHWLGQNGHKEFEEAPVAPAPTLV